MPQNYIKVILSFAFFAMSLLVTMNVQATALQFIGTAVDLETGALVYTETHNVTLDESGDYLRTEVSYVAADGQLISTKTLDFSKNKLAPKLIFSDPRNNLRYNTTLSPDYLVLETTQGGDTATDVIAISENDIVVDAGFDRMLYRHWDMLLAGNERSFDFLALTRGSTIEFTLSTVSKSDTDVRFKIEPSSWFIRVLMDPIVLDYDLKTKRLMRYEGITNIAKEGGDSNYSAIIEYRYIYEPSGVALNESVPSLTVKERSL